MTPGPQRESPLRAHGLTAAERKRVIEADRGAHAYVVWRASDGELRIVTLDGERSRTIGRSPRMDIPLDDPQVSGLHARLDCHAGRWSIVDDGMSKNGTFVDSARVVARERLVGGQLIRAGRTVIAFAAPSALTIEPTAPADDGPAISPLTAQQHRVLVALCRPVLADPRLRLPATNEEIAVELHLSVGAVKMHLRTMFAKFGLAGVRQNEKRSRLAAEALAAGLVGPLDVDR